MGWKEQIGGCFGSADLKWGSHKNDEDRARKMLKDAISAGATMRDIAAEVENHLRSKGAAQNHIDQQLQKVRDLSF